MTSPKSARAGAVTVKTTKVRTTFRIYITSEMKILLITAIVAHQETKPAYARVVEAGAEVHQAAVVLVPPGT